MSGFDDILQKGKQAVITKNPEADLLSYVGRVLQSMYQLNGVCTNKPDEHFIKSIKCTNCIKCEAALFLLVTADRNDATKSIEWRLDTQNIDSVSSGYLCEKCSKL